MTITVEWTEDPQYDAYLARCVVTEEDLEPKPRRRIVMRLCQPAPPPEKGI